MYMDTELLESTARQMMAPGKGLLVADENTASCQERFAAVGVPCNDDTRREYHDILLTTPGAEEFLSGVLLFDETFWQSAKNGVVFREHLKKHQVLPGITVDGGLVPLPGFEGELVTEGLDGLPDYITTYQSAGARFGKWRAVISIGDGKPTDECIGTNTLLLARYARICQDVGIVPVVEVEIVFEGTHTIERCKEVTAHVYDLLFQTMRAFKVHLPGLILRASMVLPGKGSGAVTDHDAVAAHTSDVLHGHVPAELGGVTFLGGGQIQRDAFINLNRIVQKGPYPWGVTFALGHPLQDPILQAWAQNRHAVHDIKQLFYRQLQIASAASLGRLDETVLAARSNSQT